jgi:hypothetical protein
MYDVGLEVLIAIVRSVPATSVHIWTSWRCIPEDGNVHHAWRSQCKYVRMMGEESM